MQNQEIIKRKFPQNCKKILKICEERSVIEKIDAYKIFLDLAEVLDEDSALDLIKTFTSSSLGDLEEIEERGDDE